MVAMRIRTWNCTTYCFGGYTSGFDCGYCVHVVIQSIASYDGNISRLLVVCD